jgi:hypothetical protein
VQASAASKLRAEPGNRGTSVRAADTMWMQQVFSDLWGSGSRGTAAVVTLCGSRCLCPVLALRESGGVRLGTLLAGWSWLSDG